MLDIGCIVMDWVHVTLDRDIYLAVVMRVKNPAVPYNVGDFLTIRATSWLFKKDPTFWSESQQNRSRPDDTTPQFSEAKCVHIAYTQLRFLPPRILPSGDVASAKLYRTVPYDCCTRHGVVQRRSTSL
jgi:hypothetical protein